LLYVTDFLFNWLFEEKFTVPEQTTYGVPSYKAAADEDYMNDAQLEHFRQILLNWKKQLLEDMERTVHHMQDEATNFPDPNDRATQEEGFAIELRTRDRELKLIRKIDESLKKIDNGDYGYCEGCGIEIGLRRLEARPTATKCIDCKTLDEQREKQTMV
jgi:DnaK suppressor protein